MRRPLGVLLAATVLNSGLSAQTTVYTTFGPGNSYQNGGGLSIIGGIPGFPTIFHAANFTYGGPNGLALSTVRLAAFGNDYGLGFPFGDATVSFMTGTDIATAALIESWTLTGWTVVSDIFFFASITGNLFVTGETFWLKVGTGPSGIAQGVWNQNDQGVTGRSYFYGPNGFWVSDNEFAPAWDVSAASTVPEPTSIALLATGFVGHAGVGFIRRRRQARVARPEES